MSDRPRAIVHLDLDAFFAAVEILENPALVGKPVIVGGSAAGRGVVTSASYPARGFGVRSAMPTFRALALCPQAIIIPPRHRVYRGYSQRVMDILHQAASQVQQTSIDEAYLDLTDEVPTWEGAVEAARQLQRRVMEEVGLSASLGIAVNRLVAKVASDRDKPGGLTVVHPGQEAAFLAPLPVRVLWGIGPVTAQKLLAMGISTVGQLAQVPEEVLQERFGRHGAGMARHALGIDNSPLSFGHEPKSIGHEVTFEHDLADLETLQQRLLRLSQSVARRLKRSELTAGTVALKLRYSDFTTLSRQMSLDVPTDDEEAIYRAALSLLQRTLIRGRPVRLLGVSAHNLRTPAGQLTLW